MTVTDLSSAPECDLIVDQGFDRDFSLQWKIDGVPANLTGWRVVLGVKQGYQEPVFLLVVDSDAPADSYATITAVDGRVLFHLDHVDTAQWPAKKYLDYDVRFYAPGGGELRKLFGQFYVRPQVTVSDA